MQNILNRDLRQLVVGYLYAFFNQLSYRKYMVRKKGMQNSEKLFKILTKAHVFTAFSPEPLMSSTLVSMIFDNYSLRYNFQNVLIKLRGTIYLDY